MVAHPRTSPPPPPCARLRSEHHSGFSLSLSGCHVGLWAAGKNKSSYQHHATSPSGKELAGNLFGCPPRGSERGSKQSQGFHGRAPVGRYGWPVSSDSQCGATFLLLTSFATGQKQAVMPERIRGDRKSQTRGKLSLFWVKCGGGSGAAAEARGEESPFQKSSPAGQVCTRLLGIRNASILMPKVETPETIRSWFPKTSRVFPKTGSEDE